MSAIRDAAAIEAKRMVVQVIARVLRTLLEGIAALDGKITEAAEAHPEFFIFQSLPGAGAALAHGCWRPWAHNAIVMPVRKRYRSRWACPKFLRQSFHEWAGHWIEQSVWARAYYQQQRHRGKDHHVRCEP
jgi:hypothetical protein